MFNLFDTFAKKRRHLIVEEEDVMVTLKVFDEANHKNKVSYLMNMEIGNCGWLDEPTKWYIFFDATNKKWKSIIAAFKKEGYKIVLGEDDKFYLT